MNLKKINETTIAFTKLTTGEKTMLTVAQAKRKIKNRISDVECQIENGDDNAREELSFLRDLLEFLG